MAKTNNTYIAKMDLPGCHKGTVITNGKYPDGTKCGYDVANEPKFFSVHTPSPPPLFATDQVVMLKKSGQYSDTLGRRTQLHPFAKFKVIDTDDKKVVTLAKESSGAHYKISEKMLTNVDVYIFVSSTGTLQYEILGRDTNNDRYRESVNNMHTTKKEAHDYIEKLKKIK